MYNLMSLTEAGNKIATIIGTVVTPYTPTGFTTLLIFSPVLFVTVADMLSY